MWFFFGIFTLVGATVWGLKTRLAARWHGYPERLGQHTFDSEEVRKKGGRLTWVRLGIQAPAGLHFRVRRERVHDRFFKWLGVSTEIQTRNPALDRAVYIESDARATAVLLKRNPDLRAALFEVFAFAKAHRLRRLSLRCAHRRLWIEFSPKVERDLFGTKAHLVPLLLTIAAGLECLDLPAEYRRDRFIWRAAAVLAFSTSAFVLGVLGLMRAAVGRTDILDPKLLFAACLVPTVLIVAAAITFVLAWLIASSRAHTVALEFALVGGLGIAMSTYSLAREANIELDPNPASRYVLTHIDTAHFISRGRLNSERHTYYLLCSDWRTGREGRPLELQISSGTYRQIVGHESAAIYVRPGLLHFDWVEKIEPVL
jgi:hypothetical protein